MTDDTEVPAGQTDASAESSPAPAFDPFTQPPEQVAQFRLTGKYPTDAHSDSSPDPSGTQSTSTDATGAASETAKPADSKAPKKNAETRIPELLAERAAIREENVRLREELARREAKPDASKSADPSTAAPTTREYDLYSQLPGFPNEDDFDRHADFVVAVSSFVADQRFEERSRRAEQEAASKDRMSGLERMMTEARSRALAAEADDPDLWSKIDPDLLKITPAFALNGEKPGPHHVLAEQIIRSEYQFPFMLYFSTPDGGKEWERLMKLPTPADLLREFGKLEARFEKRAEAAGKPPVKTVTSAPDPIKTLGKRPAEPADEARSAFEAGDYRRWKTVTNERSLAARR